MAIQITRDISVDVFKRGRVKPLYAKQYDYNSRFLNVRINADDVEVNVESTSTVAFNVERSDGSEGVFYGSVNEDGSVKVPITSWMLELAGTLLCDISIISADETVAKLTTMQFNIYVEEAVVGDDAIVETEDYNVILALIKRTEEATQKAEDCAETSAQAVKNATTAIAQVENMSFAARAVEDGGALSAEATCEVSEDGQKTVTIVLKNTKGATGATIVSIELIGQD